MSEAVKLIIDGQVNEGWESVSIEQNLNAICAGFGLTVTETWPGQPERRIIAPGAAFDLYIGDERLITGWLDEPVRDMDDRGQTITVTGRDRTSDLIDCSAVHKPGSWRNQKLEKIATDLLSPFGLTVKAEASTGPAFAHFALDQGETVADALTRLARLRGLLVGSDRQGNLILHQPSPKRVNTALVLGQNLKTLRVSDSAAERFSHIIVKGQQQGGDTVAAKDAASPKGEARDPGMTRYRPLIIISDDQSTVAGLKARAQWEVTARSARAQSVEATVKGWRDDDGNLWTPGALVPVRAARANVEAELMIAGVRFELGSETTTALTLVRPEAFSLEPLPEARKTTKGKKKKGQAVDPLLNLE